MAIKREETVFSDPEGTQHTVRTETAMEGTKRNSRGRLIMIIMGSLVFLVLAFAAIGMLGKGKKGADAAAVPATPNVDNIPGQSGSPDYNAKVDEENRDKAANADGTSLPQLSGSEPVSPIDPFPSQTVTPPVQEPEVIPPPVVEQPIPQPVEQPMYVPPEVQAPSQYQMDKYANMNGALQAYLEAWKIPPQPAQEFAFNGLVPEVAQEVPAVAGAAEGSQGPSFVRAGTVIPATLLSAVNSDNPGPILAQITSGPLAGTRLIGEFASTGQALILTFTTMSRPGMGTFSVSAVAVDDDYSVGMSTDVDNHYFRRYGLLLAASLMQGYGQAASRANTTTTTGPFGQVVTQGPLSSSQMRKAALGTMGEAISQDLLTGSDVAPTVILDCRGGCPIGLLFLSDL